MSCILRIIGENFDVDDFVLKSKIVPYKVFHKGDPKYQTKPDGEKSTHSGCSIEISKANFDDFNQQVEDTIEYLNAHQNELQFINITSGIEFAVLDFGADHDIGKFVQSHYLPRQLLKAATDLGMCIELSIYQHNE